MAELTEKANKIIIEKKIDLTTHNQNQLIDNIMIKAIFDRHIRQGLKKHILFIVLFLSRIDDPGFRSDSIRSELVA